MPVLTRLDPLAGRRRHQPRRASTTWPSSLPTSGSPRPASWPIAISGGSGRAAARAARARTAATPTGTPVAAAPSTPPSSSADDMRGQPLRRRRRPRRRQDHRRDEVRRGAASACRWSPSPPTSSHDGICSPVSTLDNDNGRGSYGVPTPIAHGHRPRRDPGGAGAVRPRRHRRRDLQPLGHRRLGALRTAITGEPSTAWPPRWPAPPASRCCATPAASATTRFLIAARRGAGALRHRHVDQRATPARPPAPATRSATPSTCSTPSAPRSHGEQVGLGAAFAMHLRGATSSPALIAERAAPPRTARAARARSASPRTSSSRRSIRAPDPPGTLHDPGTPRPLRHRDQGRLRRLCQDHP